MLDNSDLPYSFAETFIKTMFQISLKLGFLSRMRPLLMAFSVCILIQSIGHQANCQTFSSVDSFLSLADQSSVVSIKSLAFDAQTTAYQNPEGLKVFGDGAAKVLDVDASAIASVNFSDALLSDVQLIRIRINDAQEVANSISLESTSGLSQLQAILVVCSAGLNAAQIAQAFTGANAQVRLLYSLSSPK